MARFAVGLPRLSRCSPLKRSFLFGPAPRLPAIRSPAPLETVNFASQEST